MKTRTASGMVKKMRTETNLSLDQRRELVYGAEENGTATLSTLRWKYTVDYWPNRTEFVLTVEPAD